MNPNPDTCPYCNRLGLPMLALRIAYVPKFDSLIDAGLGGTRVPPTFGDGGRVLRVITEGFIYLLDMRAGGFWRCFAATPSGHLREYAADTPPPATPTFACSRDGHGLDASLINVENAIDAPEVWVGYSRAWLTPAMRRKLKADAALRKTFMLQIDASAIVKGGAVPAGSGFRAADGAQLTDVAPEYAADKTGFNAIDSHYARNTADAAQVRTAQADPLIERMHAISPDNAIVLALPDLVGMAIDTNQWRNQQAGTLAEQQAEGEQMRSRLVGDLILGLEKSMVDAGQAEEWTKRYAKHVDMGKVRQDKKVFDNTVAHIEKKILKASDDWLKVVDHANFAEAWKLYDPDSAYCGLQMEEHFADCVFGSGATRKEQEWWEPWLTASPDDDKHPVWRAFAAGDQDLIAFLVGARGKASDTGRMDKGVEVARRGQELYDEFDHWRTTRAGDAARAAQDASGMLGMVLATQLGRLAAKKPEAAEQAIAQTRMIVSTRMSVTITRYRTQVTMGEMVVQLHETVWGPPKAGLAETVREARRLKIAQSIDGAFLGGRFGSQKTLKLDVWLPEPVIKNITPAANSAAQAMPASAPRLALGGPALNHWQGSVNYVKSLKGVSGGMFGLGAVLTICNINWTLVQVKRALGGSASTDAEIKEAVAGLVSGAMGATSLLAEIYAGVVRGRVSKAVMTSTAQRLVVRSAVSRLFGALLGVLMAGIEAYLLWGKMASAGEAGDKDARQAYLGATVFAVAAGGLGIPIAIIGAAKVITTIGATGAFASGITGAAGVLSVIPVGGWALLVIGAIVAGVYFAYSAATAEDTALEIWLSRSYYRNDARYAGTSRDKFSSLKREMAEFQQAIYGLTVTLEWRDRFGKDRIDVEVLMPGYSGARSEYAFLFDLKGPGRPPLVIDRRTSGFSLDPELKPQPPAQHYLSAASPNSIPLDQVVEVGAPTRLESFGGTARLVAQVYANEDYFDTARLKFEYWPDTIGHPDLIMTPVPGGANMQEVRD